MYVLPVGLVVQVMDDSVTGLAGKDELKVR